MKFNGVILWKLSDKEKVLKQIRVIQLINKVNKALEYIS